MNGRCERLKSPPTVDPARRRGRREYSPRVQPTRSHISLEAAVGKLVKRCSQIPNCGNAYCWPPSISTAAGTVNA